MRVQNFLFADPQVFDVFTFEFLKGNPLNALQKPYSVVLTESMADKLFGKTNPVGKSVMLEKKHPFEITGVIKDIERFHLNINAIAQFSTLASMYEEEDFLNSYGSWNYPTYLLVKEGVNIPELEKKLNDHFEAVYQREFNRSGEMDFHLTALEDIYFDKDIKYEINVKHGNIRFIYVFIAIAVFILLIAAINFVNLTTAKATTRAREVGLRKIVGGTRKQLISQFLSESLLISLLSFILSLGLVEYLLPKFNELLQGEIYNHYYSEPFFWLVFIAGVLLVGLVSGLYPAFYLTAFGPVSVMKGEQTKGNKGTSFRRALTVFQFFISVVLIIGTVTIYRQIHYMKNKDLGFEQEHQVYFSITGEISDQKRAFKEELLKNPNIQSVSYTSKPAGRITWQESWEIGGEKKQFTYQPADPDYVDVMDLEIADGSNFSWDRVSQKNKRAVLLNETAVNFFGLENPVGKMINTGSPYWNDVKVVGILKDFHYNSLHKEIAPLVIAWDERGSNVNIRISANEMESTIKHMKSVWNQFVPGYPFEYHFLNQALERQYKDDERFGRLFSWFAFFAILIACLGLYGLSLFSTQQRTKEIGIRKANGASVNTIIKLFLVEFSRNVLIANLVAWPAGYFIMKQWLRNFPYRTEFELWIFGAALLVSLFIAISTVSWQTIKTASTNPAHTLRDE
jgi:putative ABC transport system permease protein